MKSYYTTIALVIPLLMLLTRQILIHVQDPSEAISKVKSRLKDLRPTEHVAAAGPEGDVIVIAAVACGNIERLGELSVMSKSAVMFSQKKSVKFFSGVL